MDETPGVLVALGNTSEVLNCVCVVGTYCGRWSIETTFEEARSALGLETTRGRCKSTVLRAGPCLFGLYAVVAVLFHALPDTKRGGACGVERHFAFHLLQHLMNVAIQHRHRAELLQI